jgi:hypothetical protein
VTDALIADGVLDAGAEVGGHSRQEVAELRAVVAEALAD